MLFLFGKHLPYTEAKRRRVHKQKIILPSTPESEVSSSPKQVTKDTQNIYKTITFSKKARVIAYELIPAVLLLVVPFSVHAGFLSKIAGIFTEEVEAQVTLDAINYSPVSTPLLSATKIPDPLKSIGGGDVSYDDEGVLLSTGPIGEDEIEASSLSKGEISVYTVKEGDALSFIAQMYGVTVNTIIWANDLSGASDIRTGDALVILPIVGVKHTVAKGETLGSIVKKYDADIAEVLEYNNLATAQDLTVGTELIVPGGELHTAKVVATAQPTKTTGGSATGASTGSGFSHPAPGSLRTQGIHGYNGVDLAGSVGTPIRAAAGGTVLVSKNSGWNGGYGNYIVVKHKNTQTLYAHLNAANVSSGDWVEQGQVIGAMGNTGKSTGTHLHFEVRGGTNPF